MIFWTGNLAEHINSQTSTVTVKQQNIRSGNLLHLVKKKKIPPLSPSSGRQCVSLAVQTLLTQAQVSMFRHSTSITVSFQALEVWQNTIPVAVSPGFESRNEFKVWSNHSQQLDRTDFHTSWICSSQKSRMRSLTSTNTVISQVLQGCTF